MKSAGGLPGKTQSGCGDRRRAAYAIGCPKTPAALFQVASQFNLLEMTGPEGNTGKWRHHLPIRPHSRPGGVRLPPVAATIYRKLLRASRVVANGQNEKIASWTD